MPDAVSETGLCDRARTGDREAFEMLRRRYGALVRGEIRQRVRQVQPADMEELELTIWLAVWQALSRFRGDSTFSTWLVAVTKNTLFNRLRQIATEQQHTASGDIEIEAVASVEWEEGAINQVAIRAVIKKLPSQEKICIYSRYFLQLTDEQIAKQTEIPLGTVKKRIRDGLKRLRDEFG